ncbi:MAG: ATP-binding protein [Prosthecobacter sp.]|nr:ATP-binding protein [Prosthecobacter sp.]
MFKTRWVISASTVIILGTALLIIYLFWRQSLEADHSYHDVEHTHDVLDNLWGLQIKARTAESSMDLYLHTGAPGALKQFQQSRIIIPEAVHYLQTLLKWDHQHTDGASAEKMNRDHDQLLEKLGLMGHLLELRLLQLESYAAEKDRTEGDTLFLRVLKERVEISAQLEVLIQDLARAQRALLFSHGQHYLSKTGQFRTVAYLWISAAILLLAGIGILFYRGQRARLHYESRLLEARDAALSAVLATESFVARVSHDIRTPMNGVLGTADLMLRDPNLTPKQRDGLETIRTSGKSLLEIINDILDLSKLQVGEMKFHNERFCLAEVVEEVIALFAASAARKNLELTSFFTTGLPKCFMGDRLRLRQVLCNLLSNAIKFTERGGVAIHVTRLPEEDASGRARLKFEVRDTGPGISKEDQARLFQPFSQVDLKMARQHGGTGLGLAISRELVLRMNGTMDVESNLGGGSTFWFTARFAIAEETSAIPGVEGRPLLIALENRPITTDAVREHALAWGLKPWVYSRMAAIAEQPPWEGQAMEPPSQVVGIIANIAPDWLEQVRRLRHLAWLKDVPIYLMADQDDIREEEMVCEGVKAVLHYPLRPSELHNQLITGGQLLPVLEKTPDLPLLLPHARVIVAEDNPVNQRVLGNQLEYLGLEVVPCVNGLEAVARVKAGEGVLVLMDCEMPEMDGFEAARKIREWERANKRAPIPIIAVTAHVLGGAADQCLQSGMNAYLGKPVELDKLQPLLLKWLPGPEGKVAATEPPPPESPAIPALNEAQLRACLTGEDVLDQDLVQMAVNQMDEMLVKMRRAQEEGPEDDWVRAAHRARGSCGTMGFAQMALLFQKAESEATSREARTQVLSELAVAHDELVRKLVEMKFAVTPASL